MRFLRQFQSRSFSCNVITENVTLCTFPTNERSHQFRRVAEKNDEIDEFSGHKIILKPFVHAHVGGIQKLCT